METNFTTTDTSKKALRSASFADETFKVKLKRKQYIQNLLETNRNILRNNNINTLHLF